MAKACSLPGSIQLLTSTIRISCLHPPALGFAGGRTLQPFPRVAVKNSQFGGKRDGSFPCDVLPPAPANLGGGRRAPGSAHPRGAARGLRGPLRRWDVLWV